MELREEDNRSKEELWNTKSQSAQLMKVTTTVEKVSSPSFAVFWT